MDDETDAFEAFERELFQIGQDSSSDSDDQTELEQILYCNTHYAAQLGGVPTVCDDRGTNNDSRDIDTKEELNIKNAKKGRKSYTLRYYDKAETSKNDVLCYNCEESGHIAKDCTRGKVVVCYSCHERGHIARDCKTMDITCYNCQQTGHIARDCKTMDKTCYNCRQTGHIARDCQKDTTCSNCAEIGHIAEDCRTPKTKVNKMSRKSRNLFKRVCHYCEKVGHFAKDCLKEKNSKVCYRCNESGHIAKECTKYKDVSNVESGEPACDKSKKSKLPKVMLNSMNCVKVGESKSSDESVVNNQLNEEDYSVVNEVDGGNDSEEKFLESIRAEYSNIISKAANEDVKNNELIYEEECHKEEPDTSLPRCLDETNKELLSDDSVLNSVMMMIDDDGTFKDDEHIECDTGDSEISIKNNSKGVIIESEGRIAKKSHRKKVKINDRLSSSNKDNEIKLIDLISGSEDSDDDILLNDILTYNKKQRKNIREKLEHDVNMEYTPSEDLGIDNHATDVQTDPDNKIEEKQVEIDTHSASATPTNKDTSLGERNEKSKKKLKGKSKRKNHLLDQTALNNLRNILGDSGDEELCDPNLISDSTLCLPSINVDTSDDTDYTFSCILDEPGAHSYEDREGRKLDETHYNPTELNDEHLSLYGLSNSPISSNSHIHFTEVYEKPERRKKRACTSNSPIKKAKDKRKTFLKSMKKHLINSINRNEVNTNHINDEPSEQGALKTAKRAKKNRGFCFRNVKQKEIILLD